MSVPLAFSMTCGMSASRRSTSVSGPNISPPAIRGSSAYATCPVAPVTTTRTVLAMASSYPSIASSRCSGVAAAVHGLGLDLDEDLRVDEIDLDDARGRPDVAEDVAVDHGDRIDVVRVTHVDPRHDHVAEIAAQVWERGPDDLDRAPRLIDDVVRHDLTVLAEAGGARDADDVPVPHRARVSELEFVLGRGRVEEAAFAVGIFER